MIPFVLQDHALLGLCVDLKRLAIEVHTATEDVRGIDMPGRYHHRPSGGQPLVFLHGFGSTKEDDADAALHPILADYRILALDAPGFGGSTCSKPTALSRVLSLVSIEENPGYGLEDRTKLANGRWRMGWDSNPRGAVNPCRFSRPVP